MKNLSIALLLAGALSLGLDAQSPSGGPAGLYTKRPKALGTTAEAVNVLLHDSDPSYTIPDGKVLWIDHFIWALEASTTSQTVLIRTANQPLSVGDFQLKFSSTAPDSWTPATPIRIVGGGNARVEILHGGPADWRDVLVVGRLVDA